eukprot:CAMPEP_0113878650 /NCGR_PEP_ID=MMETSP0780_2-20120614/6805_1 /TAXON_ID=652834 /ORGANISM="Palpitomonas bilix" /LENGTH=72 /DNA_ID=CAMNT_0000865153 /DNA_START=162 /DNA_END=380 /DNA_ORIENTATION=- /assembly_acc=CAM_ASM_000599
MRSCKHEDALREYAGLIGQKDTSFRCRIFGGDFGNGDKLFHPQAFDRLSKRVLDVADKVEALTPLNVGQYDV